MNNALVKGSSLTIELLNFLNFYKQTNKQHAIT